MLPTKTALFVFKIIHVRMKCKVSLAFSQLECILACCLPTHHVQCKKQTGCAATLIGSSPSLPLGRYLLLHLALLYHTANLPFPFYIYFVFIKFPLRIL